MIKISSNRVEGSGKGTEMGFPTINFVLDELPYGIDQGLYATIIDTLGTGISLISIHREKYRIETHIVNYSGYTNINVKVGGNISIFLLDKLRDVKRTRDIKSLISEDIALSKDFFYKTKTCLSCQLCYVQDHGYSNYTVDGSAIGCYANIFDEREYPHGDISTIFNSIGCKSMVAGEYWSLDVDGENDKPTDEWIKSMMRDVKINQIIK